jgi:excisionase family DNA binding protein
MTTTVESPYLTANEAMSYLRLGNLSSLYRLTREHRLPFCRIGRHYRFDRRELDVWLHGYSSEIEMVRAARRRA